MRIGSFATAWCLAFAVFACGGNDGSSTTVFVDSAAEPGGDGSQGRPFQTVGEAFEVAADYETIAIAPGTYGVPEDWEFESSAVIQGSLGDDTVLEAESGADARIAWTAPGELIALRELSLASGMTFSDGSFEAQNLTAGGGVTGPALALDDVEAELFAVDIDGVVEDPDQAGTGDGVVVTGGALLWRGGSSTNADDRALVISGAVATLEDLALDSRARGSLTADGGAEVDGVRISIETVRVGVFTSGSTLSLDDSDVSGAATAGLLTGPESDVTVTNSTFSDCPQGHVSVLGSNTSLVLSDNELRSAAEAPCITVSSATGGATVTGNLVDGCNGTGISLLQMASATVSDNQVSNITLDVLFGTVADGISAIDSTATFSGNQISGTAGNGIAAIRSQLTASNNTITGPGGAGISLVDPGPAQSTITNNTITGAFGVGIIALGAAAHLEGNDISATGLNPADSFGDGIAFADGADLEVIGNTTTNNARNGIVFLDGAAGEVTGNTASGNAQFGVLELCTGATNSVTVGANTLTGNTAGDMNLCSM